VPASGWYEWQKIDAKTKKPHHFQPMAKPFALADVRDVWKGDNKESITSFSSVTTSPAPRAKLRRRAAALPSFKCRFH
jgi:putative SOS response-associated peptidase YedK